MSFHQQVRRDEEAAWYAMRVTYRRELAVKRQLDENLIENFIPMHYELAIKNRQKKRVFVPVVHNLIFIHATLSAIKRIKVRIPHLQYMTEIKDKKRVPIIIPEEQMKQFIAVAGTYNDQLLYLSSEEVNLKTGTLVRIRGGMFDGLKGRLVKVKGVRNKRVVVNIQGVIAVAIATVHPDLIEIISPK